MKRKHEEKKSKKKQKKNKKKGTYQKSYFVVWKNDSIEGSGSDHFRDSLLPSNQDAELLKIFEDQTEARRYAKKYSQQWFAEEGDPLYENEDQNDDYFSQAYNHYGETLVHYVEVKEIEFITKGDKSVFEEFFDNSEESDESVTVISDEDE